MQHVGAGAERAPRLHAVDEPAAVGRRVAVTFTPATSEPKSGSVTATAFMTSAVASLRQPLLLLLLGAAGEQGPGEDLGPGDERAAGAERAAGQLLGGDDHADVLALAALAVAAVLLGDRQAEGAHLGQARR